MTKHLNRCDWAKSELSIPYHDNEWGVPSFDDRHLFEMLILEGAQAGLSWETILKKREGYREAFDNFEVERIARFTPARIEKLLANPRIVRNRLKVESAVGNAKAVLRLRKEQGPLSDYLWSFVGGEPIVNHPRSLRDIPAETDESRAMSKALKTRGFRFVGPTIMHAFMQAVGMVDDHVEECWRKSGKGAKGRSGKGR